MGLLAARDAWVLVVVASFAVVAALLQTLRLWWRAAAPAWRLRAQSRRAVEGEARAELLLARLGYEIHARQVACAWTVTADDVPVDVELRADLIVARGGRTFVAEVKTGDFAPRIESSATRRQLLEYRCAFDVDGVLLVDPESETVREIVFPLDRFRDRARTRTSPLVWLALGIALGAAAIYLAFALRLSAMCFAIGPS